MFPTGFSWAGVAGLRLAYIQWSRRHRAGINMRSRGRGRMAPSTWCCMQLQDILCHVFTVCTLQPSCVCLHA